MNQSLKSTEAFHLNVDETINRQGFELTPDDYVGVYARKSLTNDNNSIIGQLQRARDIIQNKNLLLYKEYTDDGVSATSTEIHDRKGLSLLLEDVKKGKFKTVIVYKSDRLARKPQQAIEIRKIFKDNHINVIYSSQNDFQVPTDYMGDFIQNVLMGLDELEALTISKRIAAGKRSKRLRGEYCSSQPPFGYLRPKDNCADADTRYLNGKKPEDFPGHYLPNGKAHLLEKLFLACLRLDPTMDNPLSKDDLVKYAKKLFKGVYEQDINASKIDTYINNTIYGGLLKIDSKDKTEKIISEDAEGNPQIDDDLVIECSNLIPIVDEDTYIKAFINWNNTYQKQGRKKHTYIFNGLLSCACGKIIQGSSARYKCSVSYCTSVEKEYLESILLEKIIDDLMSQSFLENCLKDRILKKIETINKDIATFQKDLEDNKLSQTEQLKCLVYDPNNSSVQDKLNELLKEEAKISRDLNQKQRQLYSINSNFIKFGNNPEINQERLQNIASYLSKSTDILLHNKNSKQTLNFINLTIEKVIIYGRGNKFEIKQIEYGN